MYAPFLYGMLLIRGYQNKNKKLDCDVSHYTRRLFSPFFVMWFPQRNRNLTMRDI